MTYRGQLPLKAMREGTAIVLLLANAFATPAMAAKPKTDPDTFYGTQVTQGPCVTPGQEFFGPILSALLGTLITTGVNKIGTALKTAGDEKTWKTTASRNLDITADEFSTGSCVQIVRGRFFTNAPPLSRRPTDLIDTKISASWQKLAANGIYVAAQPDFFFEGRLVKSTGGQALSLTPLYARLDAPIGGRALRPGQSRHIAVFLTYFAPDKAQLVTETNAAASIVLGELQPKVARDYTAAIAAGPAPAANPIGGGPDAPIAHNAYVGPVDASAWFKLALVESKQPLTLGVLVTETQEADTFLKFIGGVVGSDAVTGAVSTALKNELDPAEREKARTEEVTAAATLRTEYETALASALTKTRACSTGKPSFEAIAEARGAIRTLITKATARGFDNIGLAESDALSIKVIDPSGSVNGACAAVAVKVAALGATHP